MNLPAVDFTSLNTADLPGQAQQCVTVIKCDNKKNYILVMQILYVGDYQFDKGESEIPVNTSRRPVFSLTSEQVMVLFGP